MPPSTVTASVGLSVHIPGQDDALNSTTTTTTGGITPLVSKTQYPTTPLPTAYLTPNITYPTTFNKSSSFADANQPYPFSLPPTRSPPLSWQTPIPPYESPHYLTATRQQPSRQPTTQSGIRDELVSVPGELNTETTSPNSFTSSTSSAMQDSEYATGSRPVYTQYNTRAPFRGVSPTTRRPTATIRRPTTPRTHRRPATQASMIDENSWINQVHEITTERPYVAKRDCGIRPPMRSSRVVGGRDSQVGEFPWSVLIREQTLLGFFVKTKCGGVLIDLKWVLTAAHCQPGMFGSLVIVVGDYDLGAKAGSSSTNNRWTKPVIRKVKRMIIHRDYNPSNFDNDIALLELESPYQMQPNIVPICLPEKDEEFIGQPAMVAGWGKLSFGGPVPNVMQVAKLPVIGNKQCQDMYNNSGHIKIISDSFLCAGYANGGQDSCEGDSGGPLQVQRNDSKWVLVGTVSHGIKCAEPNLPGIYVRTAAYLPWIKAVTYHQDHNKRYGH